MICIFTQAFLNFLLFFYVGFAKTRFIRRKKKRNDGI